LIRTENNQSKIKFQSSEIHYLTVETVGNVKEDNLVQNHNQRFQPMGLEIKVFKNAICLTASLILGLKF